MEFPYKTVFANCQIKALSAAEVEEQKTALASLKNIPVDLEENSDLLGISFEAALANCINANDDGMSAENLVEVAKNFLFKPINLDHHRKMSTGFITGYSFTKYGSGQLMTEDEAKASKDKFCISLTGVIWRLVNKDLANLIEETSDIHASWEIGFSTNNLILLPKGKTDYKDGLIITAEDKDFNKISDCLRANGGGGTWGEFKVCRDIILPALPLGIGLTENPAADVKHVVKILKDVMAAETEDVSEDDESFSKIHSEMDEYMEESEAAEKINKTLNKPFRTPDGPKKFSVYVRNKKGNIVKVNFGDPNMSIKRDDPERRKNFRARHNCDQKKDKTTPGYWSCKMWSKKPVSDIA